MFTVDARLGEECARSVRQLLRIIDVACVVSLNMSSLSPMSRDARLLVINVKKL